MNPEELINAASVAMERCKDRRFGTYKLLVRKGTLLCVPRTDNQPDDIHVRTLTKWQLTNGLTSESWQDIGKKLNKVVKGIKL